MKNEEKNRVLGGVLYLVATPIGNLSDISERALKVLSEADIIAAEDTRNTLRMLTHFGISATLISYHEHNKRERGEELCSRLLGGESVALVTDAGTPAISDPGEDLVALCAERGVPVTMVPGACAGIVALTLSGRPTSRFCFEGFLPPKKSERAERLRALAREERTVLLHEAPHRLRTTLGELAESLGGGRRIAICRELTKLNEEIFRTTLSSALTYYEEHEPRGEYVLVIEGGVCEREEEKPAFTVEEQVAYYMSAGMSKGEAIKRTAKERNLRKNDVYQLFCHD